jgi:hypothetical protein
MGKRAKLDLTPELRAAMAQLREWSLKSPLRQTEEHREHLRRIRDRLPSPDELRQLGDALGFRPEAETAEPAQQVPTPPTSQEAQRAPPPKRKSGGGRPPRLTPEQRTWLRQEYARDLKAKPELAGNKAADAHVRQLAKDKFGIEFGPDSTSPLTQIIRPVRKAA